MSPSIQPLANSRGGSDAPPRAFAQGTGVLLQTVGVILFLSSCCVCSLTGLWDPARSPSEVLPHGQTFVADDQQTRLRDLIEHPGKTGFMLTVMGTTIGGLAMAVFGLGLQSEKPRAAWGALTTTVCLTLVLIVAGIGLWVGHASIVVSLWHFLLVIVTLVLVGFCVGAMKQVLANPPPHEFNVLPEEEGSKMRDQR